MKKFSELGIEPPECGFVGEKLKISKVIGKTLVVHKYAIEKSKFDKGDGNRLKLQISIQNEKHIVFTGSTTLKETIQKIPQESFPFETTIAKEDERFIFT